MFIAAVLMVIAAIFIGLFSRLDIALAFAFGGFASGYLAQALA